MILTQIGIGTLLLGLLAVNPAEEKMRNNQKENCVDLSGHWKGTCESNLGNYEDEVKIYQYGCYIIDINDQSFPIDGFEDSLTGYSDGSRHEVSVHTEYSDQMRALVFSIEGAFTSSDDTNLYKMHSIMRLSNGSLGVVTTTSWSETIKCKYDYQSSPEE